MRMDQSAELTAHEIVNSYDEKEIANILFKYADEKYSRSIAKNIIKCRHEKDIDTTFELVEVIKKSLPAKVLNSKGHPAKKTFQALRIAVNDELQIFEKTLVDVIDYVSTDGIIAVITFHSLEDRICKHVFKRHATIDIPKGLPVIINEKPIVDIVTRKPILPSEDELGANNRAHSAKLRVCKKN